MSQAAIPAEAAVRKRTQWKISSFSRASWRTLKPRYEAQTRKAAATCAAHSRPRRSPRRKATTAPQHPSAKSQPLRAVVSSRCGETALIVITGLGTRNG